MTNIKVDIKMLENGYLPASLNYNLAKTEILGGCDPLAPKPIADYSKLDYIKYKTADYYFNKLHLAIQSIPGTYEYCEEIATKYSTPLELILQRQIPTE